MTNEEKIAKVHELMKELDLIGIVFSREDAIDQIEDEMADDAVWSDFKEYWNVGNNGVGGGEIVCAMALQNAGEDFYSLKEGVNQKPAIFTKQVLFTVSRGPQDGGSRG